MHIYISFFSLYVDNVCAGFPTINKRFIDATEPDTKKDNSTLRPQERTTNLNVSGLAGGLMWKGYKLPSVSLPLGGDISPPL